MTRADREQLPMPAKRFVRENVPMLAFILAEDAPARRAETYYQAAVVHKRHARHLVRTAASTSAGVPG
ncbi:MAG: hypothetical protein OXE53_19070 [Deltaproteobacteria bacterium]|nr:hypothetical protein [Deltaproteobacteria bacterium]